MEDFKSFNDFLKESTMHYYPSTKSDDGVWDFVIDLKKSLSPQIEKELQVMKKKIMGFKASNYETQGERDSYNNWQWATIVTGLLQDRFLIKKTTLEEALVCYDKAIKLSEQENMDDNYITQLKESRENLDQLLKEKEKPSKFQNEDDGLIYQPGFME